MAKLYFYYSAMNAGKSTMLLQAAYNYREQGMTAVIYKPKIDSRGPTGKVVSRIGLSAEALEFPADYDFYQAIQLCLKSAPIDCVLVDEAQFLSKSQVLQLTMICDHLDIPVLCYGIRTDFRGEPFEGSQYLLAWAESLIEVKTICKSGRKAIMNARNDSEGNRVLEGHQVDVGHHYESMSRREFDLPNVNVSKSSSDPD
jgi:thymidine kinase